MAEEKRFIDELIEDSGKVYDESMRPILEGKAKTSFQRAILDGEEVILNLKKANADICCDLDDLDVETLAEAELAIKDQTEKLDTIKNMYKKWFGVDYK